MKRSLVLLLLGTLGWGSNAWSATNLKDVVVRDGSNVSVLFDQELKRDQIKVEYFRDIIQISLKNAAVYPAKILTFDNQDVRKVFAYQYTPDLVRCRLTVNGSATEYKGKLDYQIKGKKLDISLRPEPKVSDQVVTSAAKSEEVRAQPAPSHVLEKRETRLTDSKELPNPMIAFFWLAAILAGAAVAFFVLRALVRRGKLRGLGTVMGRFSPAKLKKLAGGIEIQSMRPLGPKKSLAIVRVKDRTLLIGISDDSINLITDLSEEEHSGMEQNFSNVLAKEEGLASDIRDLSPVGSRNSTKESSVRQRIRSRMEGMKSL